MCVCTLLAACKDDAVSTEQAGGTTPQPTKTVTPVDHLAPGELLEGTETALGLRLPRDMRVTLSMRDRVAADGLIGQELIANYVRARVKDGKMTVGASSTVFENVHVAARPDRPLRIQVETWKGRCHMEVWDVTPPKAEPDPGSDAERWRKAGYNPDGTPLDPLHMQ